MDPVALNQYLVETMQINGNMTIDCSGVCYPYSEDSWQNAEWIMYTERFWWSTADESIADQLAGVEYIKLMDTHGNYLCVYHLEDCVLELCREGESPTYWIGTPESDTYADWFEDYKYLFYHASMDIEQFVVQADNYQEALNKLGLELIPSRHLNVAPDNPYYAVEVRLIKNEVEVTDVSEDGTWARGTVYYAIRQPELSYEGYGNIKDGTGELKGWLLLDCTFHVVEIEDGLWKCGLF